MQWIPQGSVLHLSNGAPKFHGVNRKAVKKRRKRNRIARKSRQINRKK